MRQLALHVMTGSATLLILVLLAVPAKQALERQDDAQAAAEPAAVQPFAPAEHPRRVFGVDA